MKYIEELTGGTYIPEKWMKKAFYNFCELHGNTTEVLVIHIALKNQYSTFYLLSNEKYLNKVIIATIFLLTQIQIFISLSDSTKTIRI